MGDNPLIGENDSELGIRFPDMSNAYDKNEYSKIYKVIRNKKIKINEAVYIGTIGPETETEAEARFYREIGADVTGYSLVPEDITAVHAGISYCAIGLISRNLVADKMMEDTRTEKDKEKDQKENLKKSLKILSKIIKEIIEKL
jgi:purine-nucleoside phosphorylase